MKTLTIILCLVFHSQLASQIPHATANIRVSFLLIPFTPLVTVETKIVNRITFQLESDFRTTHGINIKWFTQNRMDGGYVFSGMAFVKNKNLRADNQFALLPYAGYGIAKRINPKKAWIWDTRFGLGPILNADQFAVYPVIKSGFGKVF